MAFRKCPGQDLSQKKPDEIVCDLPCPSCGAEVEFFFDDKIRICPSCGKKVQKNGPRLRQDFGCARWCEAAEKCLGPETYKKLADANKKKTTR